MTRSVDNRVVEMRFDNAQFEKGITQSTTSLDNLKKSLNLEGAAKGLNELGRVGKGFTLNSIGESVDYVASRFSALSIIGITALQNITNSAMDAGKRLVSSLTIDPIKTGLTEYETKMGAIQTILTNTASKGTKIEEVNEVLDELNAYSDQTIYNFGEMAKNIGTFTAAGVGLKESAVAIKGIANLAAGSGSTSLQASTAMYQLSQALAAGSVKLQDWNSVVNAGMGGELFQNALKDTAKQLGIMVDQTVPFRESLKDGWITADVLTKTLEKFANDKSLIQAATQVKTYTELINTMRESVQSGWAQTWEAIIGDKEQAATLFTDINNAFSSMIQPATEARIAMFEYWNEMGGRRMVLAGLTDGLKTIQAILKPIGDAFREVFPAMTGERLVELSRGFQELMRNFKIGETTAANIKSTFKGLFALLDIGIQIFAAIGKVVGGFLKELLPVGPGFLSITAGLGDYLVSLRDMLKETDGISKFFTTIATALSGLATDMKGSIGKMVESMDAFAKGDGLKALTDLKEKLGAPIRFLQEMFGKLATTFGELKTKIGEFFDGINWGAVFGVGLAGGASVGLFKIIKGIWDLFQKGGNVMDSIAGVLDGVRGALEAYQNQLKAGALIKIAIAVALLAGALAVLATIDPAKILPAIGAMTALFAELFIAMGLFDKFVGGKGGGDLIKVGFAMVGVATAMLVLANALKAVSEIPEDAIWRGVTALGLLMTLLITSATVLSQADGKILKSSLGLNAFAAAITILVKVVERISKMEWDELGRGLAGLAAIVGLLAAFSALFALPTMKNMTVGTGLALLAIAVAMQVMVGVVEKFGKMDVGVMAQGLGAMAAILIAMGVFLALASSISLSTGIGLIALAGALSLLTGVLIRLGNIPFGNLMQGLGAMAGVLILVALALRAIPADAAIKGIGLIVLSVALNMLTGVLAKLGALPLKTIGIGLLAMAGIFLVLGVATALLTPLIIPLMALSLAILMLGVATLAVGAGLVLFAAGLTSLVLIGPAAITLMTEMATAMLNLIPLTVKKFGEGIVELILVIGNSAAAISDAFVKVILAIIDAMVQTVPAFVDGVFVLLTAFLTTLVLRTPELIKQGSAFVRALMDGLAVELPALIQSAINMMVAFIDGLANGIRNNTEKILLAGQNLITALLEAMFLLLTTSLVDWEQLGKTIMESGFGKGVQSSVDNIVKWCKEIVDKMIAKILEFKDKFIDAGKQVINGFVQGIKSKIDEAKTWAANLGKTTVGATASELRVKSPSKAFEELGMYSAMGLAVGLRKYADLAATEASNIGSSAIDGLRNSISKISDIVGNSIDMEPTIRPVLDLTDVIKGANKIDGLFNSNQMVSLAGQISAVKQSSQVNPPSFPQTVSKDPTAINFVQNNYSPKALSRLDIYRQTRNQFSAMKGLVSGQ